MSKRDDRRKLELKREQLRRLTEIDGEALRAAAGGFEVWNDICGRGPSRCCH